MTEDISRMSNQERIALLGVDEASKYRGPVTRKNSQVDYLPSCTVDGGNFYLAQLALKSENKNYRILPCPQEYLIPAGKAPRRKQEILQETT